MYYSYEIEECFSRLFYNVSRNYFSITQGELRRDLSPSFVRDRKISLFWENGFPIGIFLEGNIRWSVCLDPSQVFVLISYVSSLFFHATGIYKHS